MNLRKLTSCFAVSGMALLQTQCEPIPTGHVPATSAAVVQRMRADLVAKHLVIVCSVLAFHFLLLVVCICCRRWLVALCDFCFLEVRTPPEGPLTADCLRKLWGAPTDGMDLAVSFDSEGAWRELLRPDDERTADL